MKKLLVASVVLFSGALVSVAVAQQKPNRPGGVVILTANEVQWTDYPGRPGVKLSVIDGDINRPGPFIMRVRFPAGYKLPPHTHPSMEHTTVLSGVMNLGYGTKGDEGTESLPAGTIILTPANTPHFAFMNEETIVQTHGVGPWGSTAVTQP